MHKIACEGFNLEKFKVLEEANEVFCKHLDIFNGECSPFWSGLSYLIRSMPYTKPPDCARFLSEVITVMKMLLEMKDLSFEHITSFLPLDDLHGSIKQLANNDHMMYDQLLEQSYQLLLKREDLRVNNFIISKNPAYVILPTMSELKFQGISKHITAHQNTFASNKDYLCRQYHLFREDFVNPLRKVFQQNKHNDCKMYDNVRFISKKVSLEGMLYTFSFQLPGNKRNHSWEHSKLPTNGSLVCLSRDNFCSIFYATVAEGEHEYPQNKVITLNILDKLHEVTPFSCDDSYKMIESPAYFEAYAPVISSLKAMLQNPRDLPFADYLVKGNANVRLPFYLRRDEKMNLSGILCKCDVDTCTHTAVSQMNVCNEGSWYKLPCNNLDESQVEALKIALTSELPLIQGPPGTGKTHVGVCLVQALLLNKNLITNAPLLVMSFTNHALDQFLSELENKIPEKHKILRIGGGSKSEQIKKLNVQHQLRHSLRQTKHINKTMPNTVLDALKELCRGKKYYSENLTLHCSFLHPDEIKHLPELAKMYSARLNVQNVLEYFGIDVSKSLNSRDNDDIVHLFKIQTIDERYNSRGKEVLKNVKSKHHICKFFQNVIQASTEKSKLFKQYLCIRYTSLKKKFHKLSENLDRKEDEITISALQKADIIGLTTTGASKYNNIIKRLNSKILIVEEAAEVVESHIVAALTKHTKQLILIGDHKQLRPKTNDYTIGKKYGLEISLFERLVKNGFLSVQLKYQYRMRPEISSLISPHIYEELLNHEVVLEYKNIQGMESNLFFINHTQNESEVEGLKSPKNDYEALMLAKLAKYLLQQGYAPSEITVLTPYNGQVSCIKSRFANGEIQNIKIVTIDNFQGEENEIILLSLVRTAKIGFLCEENRICVAFSRAKKGFYCIGNFNFLKSRSPLLQKIVCSLNEKNLIGDTLYLKCKNHGNRTEISHPDDFRNAKDGGCSKICNYHLNCRHICSMFCHPNEDVHNKCFEQCSKTICSNNHPCPLKCFEKCEPCITEVRKQIPKCGHKQLVPCSIHPANVTCQKRCVKILICGHEALGICGIGVHQMKCKQIVSIKLSCGHWAQIECYRSLEHFECKHKCQTKLLCGHLCSGTCSSCKQKKLHVLCKIKCTRVLTCGHECASITCCSSECPPCIKKCPIRCSHGSCDHACSEPCIYCTKPCEWKCPHYRCTRLCGDMCDRPPCDEPCEKTLECGHLCIGLCGELCPSVCRICDPTNEAFDILFGSEDEAESRFIALHDCKHIFEVDGFDKWIKEREDNQIQWKSCPKCNTMIKSSFRYANVIKTIKNDMNHIKTNTHYLSLSERQRLYNEIAELNHILNKQVSLNNNSLHLRDSVLQSTHLLLMAEYECKQLFKKITFSNHPSARQFQKQVDDFFCFLNSDTCQSLASFPAQVFHDIQNERNRLLLLFKIYETEAVLAQRSIIPSYQDKKYIHDTLLLINPSSGTLPLNFEVDNNVYTQHLNIIKEIRAKYSLDGLADEEMRTIVSAIGGRQGSWYKCPNGHYYNIDRCGSAVEEGQCYECRERIGGRNKILLETNSRADI
jgi:hypothetical protein